MQKATYMKKKRDLLLTGGFVRKAQDKLESDVVEYVMTSLEHYKNDRNVNHVTAAAVALTLFNRKGWLNAYYKAAKDLLALHNDFNVTVSADADDPSKLTVVWANGRVPKDKRPQYLPSLESTQSELARAFRDATKPKAPISDEEKAARELKRFFNSAMNFDGVRAAVMNAGVEDKRLFVTMYDKLLEDLKAELQPHQAVATG